MTALSRLRAARRPWAVDLATLAVLVLLALTVVPSIPIFRAQTWASYGIYGLLALSFTFVWGHAGIFSFGQVAFFGLGGYAYGIAGFDLIGDTQESLSALALAVVIGAIAAALLGYFIFYGNVGDVFVAIITLAATLVLLTFMSSTAGPNYHVGDALLGGYNGLAGVPPLTLPGADPLDPRGLLTVTVIAAAAVTVGLHVLLRRPFGRVLAGMRENELRTQLLGYDVRRYKLIAFAISGAVAGLAGGLFTAWGTFISPSVFSLSQAALVAIWVLVGGRRSLVGAFVGVVLVQELSSRLGSGGGSSTPIVLGAVLIAIVLFVPEGLVPGAVSLGRRLLPRRRSAPGTSPARAAPAGVVEPPPERIGSAIAGVDVRKRFGGLTALDGASLTVAPNGVHCLIGPNGAGKSTFFNLLVGRYRPTAGEILLDGDSITRRRPDQRARRGIGIKLQVPSIFLELSTFENVWLAAYARHRNVARANAAARRMIDWLQLAGRADRPAGELSHGQHQWLEIGMVMAAEPTVVLLDEPTAGMTREETLRTVELVREVARTTTVLIVEHDMEFVRQLDVPVTMFHEGRVFASGSIDELRADERILDIYLGRSGSHVAG